MRKVMSPKVHRVVDERIPSRPNVVSIFSALVPLPHLLHATALSALKRICPVGR